MLEFPVYAEDLKVPRLMQRTEIIDMMPFSFLYYLSIK